MSTPFDAPTFSDAFQLLLKVQAPKSANTYAQAKYIIKTLEWFEINCPDLESFQRDYESHWADYRVFCGKKRKLGHSRRYLIQALHRARAKGWIEKKFSKADFALFESTESIGKYVEDHDVKKLLSAMSDHPKALLQVKMGLVMGMRLSEILQLRVVEVDLKRREINLDPARLKTRKARKVPIPIANSVFDSLSDFVKAAPGPFVFPATDTKLGGPKHPTVIPDKPQKDLRFHWDKAREDSGVDCRFHDLRHTCITNALTSGMPALVCSKIFGATVQVIDRIYSHVTDKASENFRSVFDMKFEDKIASPDAKPDESEGENQS